ncbi:hypothetical protein CAI16_02805 [Virgibacillus dokdonensis]|uniref:Uncharacterized protein n=1 Tax=Virgibacillus dokdonensis TaxID=302167 RepID=A0A3E0WXX4_9BACI|nr:SIR2 family protein [Virgibacillus dokdonensis]RFA37021.1 hypothetical protein CAI16_02805 [Virgibacillus dokdonensis]
MHILDQLIKNNEYPIIFIGSGMSKRYLADFPTWEELLQEYWNSIGKSRNFYSFLSTLSKDIRKEHPEYNKDRLEFETNISVAQYISEKYNEEFLNGNVKVSGLDYQKAYHQDISAFKYSLSNRFKTYNIKSEMKSELTLFEQVLKKAQIIVTTNYDNFIEDVYSKGGKEELKVYNNNSGFFNDTEGWAELYKIHGSVEECNSIVITKEDYALYDKNKILISAKLISAMVNSPIIFIGYSLKDVNVQNLISDFASQLPNEDSRKSAQRIIVVEREEGEPNIVEKQVREYTYGWNYTLLKTDNYSKLFEKLSKINQGLSPYHVRKYNQVIKKLVVAKGKNGALESVLLTPYELESIESRINAGKPIVLAIGDKATIFKMPNLVTYLKDYFFDKNEFMPEVALSFVARNPSNARIPFLKYINDVEIEELDLTRSEKDKIYTRIDSHGKIDCCITTINKSHQITANSISEIKNFGFGKPKEIDVVVYNIKNIEENELKNYVEEVVENLLPNVGKSPIITPIRRIVTAYDFILNGKTKIPKIER